jgi:hypothetical protein
MSFEVTSDSVHTLLPANSFNVGTSAIQISGQAGGLGEATVLSNVGANYHPAYRRLGFFFTNYSTSGATVALGTNNTVTMTANYLYIIPANGVPVWIAGRGSRQMFAIASAAATPCGLVEGM